MPEVTLRAYTKQIDELIERERLKEAIAHCRHILHGYPKHIETYRHLGKAYLEAKRYGDAADIVQRVLSAAAIWVVLFGIVGFFYMREVPGGWWRPFLAATAGVLLAIAIDRHRHAESDRKQRGDGFLWPDRRQCQRNRPNGLAGGGRPRYGTGPPDHG